MGKFLASGTVISIVKINKYNNNVNVYVCMCAKNNGNKIVVVDNVSPQLALTITAQSNLKN